MQVGDLVRVKWTNPTVKDPNIGVVLERIQFGKSKFAKVTLTNGYIATYRLSNLEVISESR